MKLLNTLVLLFFISLTCWLSACQKQEKTTTPPHIKIAVALGGGGFKGFAHIGVLKTLKKHNIPIEIITGTSSGSIIGSLFASGMEISELEEQAKKFIPIELIDFTFKPNYFIKGHKLAKMINQAVHFKNIEDFPIKFAAITTEKKTGKIKIIDHGNPGTAVRASSSVPGIFEPVKIENIYYVDGGLSSPVPVTAAKMLGADIVIAVDISSPNEITFIQSSLLKYYDQTLGMMNPALLKEELDKADIIIRPNLNKIGTITGFSKIEEAIQSGEEATEQLLPLIKNKLLEKPTKNRFEGN